MLSEHLSKLRPYYANGTKLYAVKVDPVSPDRNLAESIYRNAGRALIQTCRESSIPRYRDHLWQIAAREYLELHTLGEHGTFVRGLVAIPLDARDRTENEPLFQTATDEPWLLPGDTAMIHQHITDAIAAAMDAHSSSSP